MRAHSSESTLHSLRCRHCFVVLLGALSRSAPQRPRTFRARAPEDEVIYFVLPDRFENGDRGERSRRPARAIG